MSSWPTMECRGPSVADADVAAFEQQFGLTLPDDYRDFLLHVNGGRTDNSHCEFRHGILNQLFSLNAPEEDYELSAWNERVRKDIGAPELIIVGMDDGGGRLLLVVNGPHLGEVWFQVHEGRPPESNLRATWEHRRDFKKLADNFEEFMLSLKPLK